MLFWTILDPPPLSCLIPETGVLWGEWGEGYHPGFTKFCSPLDDDTWYTSLQARIHCIGYPMRVPPPSPTLLHTAHTHLLLSHLPTACVAPEADWSRSGSPSLPHLLPLKKKSQTFAKINIFSSTDGNSVIQTPLYRQRLPPAHITIYMPVYL